MSNPTSNQQLAENLARRVFACGDDGPTRKAVRLQYRTGDLKNEHDGGGFIESAFASYLKTLLDELRPAVETAAPPRNLMRYKVQQDHGQYCLKGCPDGDLVDYSAYEALLRRLPDKTEGSPR